MAHVALTAVDKSFGKVDVIRNVNLDIEDGEFVVFVGPSGCGKSTLLRLIAGLEDLSAGEIHIDGQRVDHLAPAQRGVAMVFQSYALYPHFTVRQNMGYALRVAREDKATIAQKVEAAAEVLQLTEYLDRKPKALSGGQRQRVAIGRAIVRDPKVFLFDEPLSNLDAKLRVQMRIELTKLHAKLGATMIYVTHDQVEAMTMADKIVVLKDGVVEQVGAPLDLYNRPANLFVAGFIGSPAMNFIRTAVEAENGKIAFVHKNFRLVVEGPFAEELKPYVGKEVWLGIRPEDIKLRSEATPGEHTVIRGIVDVVEPLGAETEIHVRLEDVKITARIQGYEPLKPEQTVELEVDTAMLHAFDVETEKAIAHALAFVE